VGGGLDLHLKLGIKDFHIQLVLMDLLLTDTLGLCFVALLVAETGDFMRLSQTSDHTWLGVLRRILSGRIAKVVWNCSTMTNVDGLHGQIHSIDRIWVRSSSGRGGRVRGEIVRSMCSGVCHHASVATSWCTIGGVVL